MGQQAELAFIALAAQHGIILTQTDGRKGDLIDSDDNTWECKGDQYDHDKTENFFIELYSDVDKGKPGGCYKALADGCKYFVYFFSKNNVAYVFETVDICRQFEQYLQLNKPKPVEVPNKSWLTIGFKIPRSSLVPLSVLKKKVKL